MDSTQRFPCPPPLPVKHLYSHLSNAALALSWHLLTAGMKTASCSVIMSSRNLSSQRFLKTGNAATTFKRQMDLIMLSENGFASSTDILNLADQLKTKKMKKKEAEQMLKVFVENKWLSERNGEYTLHTRCIIEMEQYILTNYPDTARKCNICHSLAIQSQVCESCGTGMHLPCVRKYFRAQTEPRCPQCNTTWSCDIPGTHPRDSQSPSRTRRAEKSFTLSTR
ncbi:non-structural maintenance of chromosomes element 1 homolog isoform X2 [Strix uralensis]|uniref:non-structural maintenance of chromosomes element 1 homolog isoform X2 n=1 Tax=Strix uralensis TaxID=36305 RepID=UPI003DA4DE92